jgi:excisionase family DNA binding protein
MTSFMSVETLTILEAAAALKVSRRHLQSLWAKGDGPPVIRLGRRCIIRRDALDQWLTKREVAHAPAR